MRLLIVALLFGTGCPVQGDDCNVDNECEAAEVCARDHNCVPPDQVRSTRTTWTVDGLPADMTSCAGFTFQFQILFKPSINDGTEDKLGFAPVPCFTGLFTVDKLPVRYLAVKLLNEETHETIAQGVEFAADGSAEIQLTTP